MSVLLRDLRDRLNYLREYLIKIGPERRQKEIAYKKLEEAKNIYSQLDCILSQVNNDIKTNKLDSSTVKICNDLVREISDIYTKIKDLVRFVDSADQISLEEDIAKMSNPFDIKTAIALLPVMTGQEQTTKQLIDGILMYDSLISDSTKGQLIDFVLKTRLSVSAKLRLRSSYNNVKDLVEDIRKYLLPKKSSQAIQAQLFRAQQGRRTIESFGSELEELFVNLTIAQADEDTSKYDVLRPLNERTAIKQFADGLSDQRLSTIIASRQFDSLPEAIRAAVDEQLTSTHDQVMQMRHVYNRRDSGYASHRGNFTPFNTRSSQTYYNRSNMNHQPRPYFHNQQKIQFQPKVGNRGAHASRFMRSQHVRGHSASARAAAPRMRVQHAAGDNNNTSENMSSRSQFFRS